MHFIFIPCYHTNMSIENPNHFETEREHIPNAEEVRAVFKELTTKECAEVRKLEDEQGLYLLEATVPGDLAGEVIEYGYMRKGHYKEGESSETEIHVTYYQDGMPVSGTSAARYVNGKWLVL